MQSSLTVSKNKVPIASFSMQLPLVGTDRLIQGKLIVTDPDGSSTKYEATSGCPGNQFEGSYKLKGRGCLPPNEAIREECYHIRTKRLWLPNIPGVEGSFYEIDPDMVNCGGIFRGDFGVHYDARYPGSAGCIVMRIQGHWDSFRAQMQKFFDSGINAIELHVDYKSAIRK